MAQNSVWASHFFSLIQSTYGFFPDQKLGSRTRRKITRLPLISVEGHAIDALAWVSASKADKKTDEMDARMVLTPLGSGQCPHGAWASHGWTAGISSPSSCDGQQVFECSKTVRNYPTKVKHGFRLWRRMMIFQGGLGQPSCGLPGADASAGRRTQLRARCKARTTSDSVTMPTSTCASSTMGRWW